MLLWILEDVKKQPHTTEVSIHGEGEGGGGLRLRYAGAGFSSP